MSVTATLSLLKETPDSTEEHEELVVTFNPPLYLQRQIWLLNNLTREKVRSVLDIGCGEGNLLQCLTEPSVACLPPESFQTSDELYIHTVHGLDPSAQDLGSTLKRTAPTDSGDASPFDSTEKYMWKPFQPPRWNTLQVHLWNGGFENLNHAAFGNDKVDAFVATEVIEHLTSNLLPLFAPILFGYYRPRLILLTTPNYTYNQRFHHPDRRPLSGFPDPTGRTNRIFRHHDHKFEWTTEEWTSYCNKTATEYGYEVEVSGIGQAVEPDPWSRESILGYATQVAIFRRIDNRVVAVPSIVFSTPAPEPTRIITHTHLPFPLSSEELSIPPSVADVLKAVQEAFTDNLCKSLSFREIWRTQAVPMACKGDVRHLHQTFQTGNFDADDWNVKDTVGDGWTTEITWNRFEMPESGRSTPTLIEPRDSDDTVSYDEDGDDNKPRFKWHVYGSSGEKHGLNNRTSDDDDDDGWSAWGGTLRWGEE